MHVLIPCESFTPLGHLQGPPGVFGGGAFTDISKSFTYISIKPHNPRLLGVIIIIIYYIIIIYFPFADGKGKKENATSSPISHS